MVFKIGPFRVLENFPLIFRSVNAGLCDFNPLVEKGMVLVRTFKTEVGIPMVAMALSFMTFPACPVLYPLSLYFSLSPFLNEGVWGKALIFLNHSVSSYEFALWESSRYHLAYYFIWNNLNRIYVHLEMYSTCSLNPAG